jgi:hypothetical protein
MLPHLLIVSWSRGNANQCPKQQRPVDVVPPASRHYSPEHRFGHTEQVGMTTEPARQPAPASSANLPRLAPIADLAPRCISHT